MKSVKLVPRSPVLLMVVAVLLVIAAAVGATARWDWQLRAAASQSPS